MWQAFRTFRRSRPFWAGLFTMLGGLEILALPLSPIADLILLGVAGISGAVIGIVLLVTGAFMWFSPPNRTLAGVLTLVFSLVSFVVSNLGGLIVGMVLGLVGGALALAWTPDGNARARRGWRRRGRSEQAAEPPTTRFPRIDGPAGVALVIGLVAVLHTSGPAVAHAAPPPPPEPPPTDESGPLLGLPPLLAPSPGPSPGPAPVEAPLDVDGPAGPLLPDVLPELAQQTPPGLLAPLQPAAVPDDGVVVSGLIGNLQLDTLTVTNFRYEGMVTYPVAGGGTQRALRIVLDTTDLGNVRIVIPGGDGSVRVVQGEGAPNGSTTRLVLECTRIRLNAFGVLPLEFSLDFPPPPLIVIPFLSATDVDIDYVRLSTPTLIIPGLVASADGPAGTSGPGLDGASLATHAAVPTAQQADLLVALAALLDLPSMLRPYGLTQREAAAAVTAAEPPDRA